MPDNSGSCFTISGRTAFVADRTKYCKTLLTFCNLKRTATYCPSKHQRIKYKQYFDH